MYLASRQSKIWEAQMPCGVEVSFFLATAAYPNMFKGESELRPMVVVLSDHGYVCAHLALTVSGEAYVDTEGYEGCPKCPGQSVEATVFHVAEAIARDFGASSISLHDSSFLACDKNEDSGTSLPVFGLLTKGVTWYEDHGYKFDEAVETVDELLTCDDPTDCAQDLQRDALIHAGKQLVPSAAEPKLAAYIQEANSRTLGGFLAWLWFHHCDTYEELVAPWVLPDKPNLSLVYVGSGRVEDEPFFWGTVRTGMRKRMVQMPIARLWK